MFQRDFKYVLGTQENTGVNSTAERGSILFDKYISPTTRRQYQLQTSVG